MVSDLKRIAEKQLKEIVMLQREIEMVNESKRKAGHIELDNPVWSQTDDTFKSPCRLPNKKAMNERQQLLQLCEDLES